MKFLILLSLFVFGFSQTFLSFDTPVIPPPANVTNSTNSTNTTTTSGPTTINQLTSTLKNLIPTLQGQMQNNPQFSSSVVQQIVKTGLSSFSESGSIQQSNGVYDQYIEYFLKSLKGQISLPTEYGTKFDTYISQVLNESNGTWVEFSAVFSLPQTEQMKFVCIFAKNNPEQNNSDWIVANIQDTFKLVTTTIMETKSCQMVTQDNTTSQVCTTNVTSTEVPATQQQIECVIDFLEIAAYKKIIAAFSNETELSLPKRIQQEAMACFILVCEAIKAACKIWEGICKVFGSSETTTIKEILTGQGFQYFTQTAQTQKVTGLKDEYLQDFVNQLAWRIDVPATKQQAFADVLQGIIYEGSTDWNAYHIVYTQGTGGNITYAILMMNHNSTTNTTNFLVASMEASFLLMPDVMVIETQKSILGGMFQSAGYSLKDIPQALTQTEVQQLFDFFYIVGLESIANLMGIVEPLPTIPSSE